MILAGSGTGGSRVSSPAGRPAAEDRETSARPSGPSAPISWRRPVTPGGRPVSGDTSSPCSAPRTPPPPASKVTNRIAISPARVLVGDYLGGGDGGVPQVGVVAEHRARGDPPDAAGAAEDVND